MADTKFTTSFIPKKPIQTVGSGGRITKSSHYNLFTVVTVIIFLATGVVTGGAYLYEFKLNNDIEKQNQNLIAATKELDQQFITEAIRLNDRIIGVQKLLDNHLSPSQIFFLLEEKTIETVRFNELDFSFNDDGDLLLKGTGQASGFESIIQQSDEYGKRGYLRDVIFSELQNEEQGLVSFAFESKIDPELILFRNAMDDASSDSFIQNEDGEVDVVSGEGNDSQDAVQNPPATSPSQSTSSPAQTTPTPSSSSTSTTDSGLINNMQ